MPSPNVAFVHSSHLNHQDDNNDDRAQHEQQQAINNMNPSSPQSSYNSSYGSNSGKNLLNNNSNNTSITSLVPGGVVTTQNISTVIKPKSNNNSLQFVKIQTPELSKKAVEQIKLAEETKISKSKIKEGEEEWQNHLLNWKSKRRQHTNHTVETNDPFESCDTNGGRKIKTFAEMMEQRAKSGNRLGFHLQRYISAEDEDDNHHFEQDQVGELNLNNNNDNKLGYNNDDSKNRADSDYEAQSSASSGYNQLDSKSPSSPDIPELIENSNKTPSEQSTPKCDRSIPTNNNSISIDHEKFDERDHSISLVGRTGQMRPLNSTFKQDIIAEHSPIQFMPNNGNVIFNRSSASSHINDDSKSEVVSAQSEEDESDNSGFEEDEEEEEQKQLQRIAFEAKLKAFEKLTVPASQTPPPPPKPSRLMNKKTNVAPPVQKEPPRSENSNTGYEGNQKVLPPKLTRERPVINDFDIVRSNNQDDRLQASLDNLTLLTINNQNIHQHPPPQPVVPQSHQKSQTTIIHTSANPQQIIHQSRQKETYTQQISAKQPNLPSSPIIEHIETSPDTIQNRMTKPTPIPSNLFSQNEIPQKPRNIPSIAQKQQPLPDPLIQNISPPPPPPPSIQKKPSKTDEKDRTVLSVSGKKRCSSCKEELGRGAAAFVVESLSLVYHTNCFRCSVCHVNLANGFRGVDVRVHAGALHCQNCYSRDGLNFSRV